MSEKLVEIKDLKMRTSLSTKEKLSHLLESLVVVRQQLVVLLSVLMIPAKVISSLKVKKLMVKNHVNKLRN